MNYLNLSDDFLKAAEQYCTYDPDIPFPFRVLAKLLAESRCSADNGRKSRCIHWNIQLDAAGFCC